MNKINHEVFGVLIDNGGWRRKEKINFWGIQKEVDIMVYADTIPNFKEYQKNSYIEFKKITDEFLRDAKFSAYKYYLSVYEELRERFEHDADKLAPIVNNENEFAKLINPTTILFPFIFNDEKTSFGILFDCKWDPSHGLAVLFENGKVTEVGEQDIIL